ncbi:MAG: hypothetical protein KKD39_06825 [Candidatus Altiarchaeota archaeon]|nr:hypothetical protein [Candidatus Altiarchaeota archaeon]
MRKGYVVTLDALISLSFVMFLILGFIGLQHTKQESRGTSSFEQLHSIAENAIDTSNKEGVLERIAYYWADENASAAGNATKQCFDPLIPPNVGYRLEVVDASGVHVIYQSGSERPTPESAADQTNAMRIISGYREEVPRTGWVARASLEETNIWSNRLLYLDSSCASGYSSVVLQYDPGVTTSGNIFYVKAPEDASLDFAQMNVSWVRAPTSSTMTTSTLSTTTTTLVPGTCHACPVTEVDCEVQDSTYNIWYTPGVGSSEYNYHSFTVPAGGCNNIKVRMYSSTYIGSPWNRNVNYYFLYMNWTVGECQRPYDPHPTHANWDCDTYYGSGQDQLTKTCSIAHLDPGTYTFMVDCHDNPAAWELCDRDYYIYIRDSTGRCNIGSAP